MPQEAGASAEGTATRNSFSPPEGVEKRLFAVIPAKAGIHGLQELRDPRGDDLRGHDGEEGEGNQGARSEYAGRKHPAHGPPAVRALLEAHHGRLPEEDHIRIFHAQDQARGEDRQEGHVAHEHVIPFQG